MSLLEVRNLKTYYYTLSGVVKAVDNVSFDLKEGEVLGIAGESGCGKSTLAWSLLKLVPPPGKIAGGEIVIDGDTVTDMTEEEVRRKVRWRKISMIFQGAMNSLHPMYNIGEQLIEALKYHSGEEFNEEEAIAKAGELLEDVGLSKDMVKRYPHELSGGQKQRVVIAMALMADPKIVIADEPTTALDVIVQAQILNLFKKLRKDKNLSMIFITHDLSVIAEIADKVAIMYAGKIVEFGTSEQVFLNPMHPYTQGLLKSIPRIKSKEKIEWIPGVPPGLANPPPGCRFHPRCPYVMDVCRREEPPMIEVEPGHYVSCWLHAKK